MMNYNDFKKLNKEFAVKEDKLITTFTKYNTIQKADGTIINRNRDEKKLLKGINSIIRMETAMEVLTKYHNKSFSFNNVKNTFNPKFKKLEKLAHRKLGKNEKYIWIQL